MDPFSIISLIFGIIMTGVEIAATAQANKENKEFQQSVLNQQQSYATQAAETANKTTEQQYWDLYSPAAKVQQLKDAGLSVGLYYGGGGGSGTGGTAAQAATPSTSLPYINPLLQPGQMGNVMNVLKTITESQKTQEETKKVTEETKNLEKAREQISKNIEEIDANIKLLEQKAGTEALTQVNMDLQNQILTIQKDYESQTLDKKIEIVTESYNILVAQEENLWEDLNGKNIDNKWKPKMYKAEEDKLIAEKNKLTVEKTLILAQTTTEEAKKLLTNAQYTLTVAEKEELATCISKLEAETKKVQKETQAIENKDSRDQAEMYTGLIIDYLNVLAKFFSKGK